MVMAASASMNMPMMRKAMFTMRSMTYLLSVRETRAVLRARVMPSMVTSQEKAAAPQMRHRMPALSRAVSIRA